MNAPEQLSSLESSVSSASRAPNDTSDTSESLYEVRKTIYPRAVHGWFATWRWTFVFLTQLVFYGLAWLPWNGRQAVLFDLTARKFYIFGLVLWPQDVVYLAVLLVISALSLFLFTAVGGRLFCGYACPQTVYTEIFMWIERRIEGDRSARMRLDQSALGPAKFARKSAKHLAWAALALWTGFTFVGYFTPIRSLAAGVMSASLGPWETFWILFYGFATYGNAGWMREQVCKYMCPYARFQSSMFDRDTLIITYDGERGEPRGSRSKKTDRKALAAKGLGDCVDCGICVQVCPTGIDIRKGLQYECIGCAACIDGCNQVMDKMGYPRGLIRYSTENAVKHHWTFRQMVAHVLRPRTLVYSSLLALIIAGFVTSLVLRVPLKVDVIRDRGALAREVEGGMIENVYRLQIMNTEETSRRYKIDVSGVDTIAIASEDVVEVPAATIKGMPVRVHVLPGHGAAGSNKIVFNIRSEGGTSAAPVEVHEKSVFILPR